MAAKGDRHAERYTDPALRRLYDHRSTGLKKRAEEKGILVEDLFRLLQQPVR
jgi:hypothetical protein